MATNILNRKEQNDADSDSSEDLNCSDEEGGLRVDGIYIPPPPQPYCSTENKGPRLIITKITNNFFKSYAGSTIVGPFHKCFNAVVGPNGSGKSNVIDSMLFVFGYRASKIRSKKISVLLHNSEKYRNVQSCTVSVHFTEIIDKDGDSYEIISGTEFVVSRTAHKDNSSYYTLNGRRVQFKEVATVLKKHGIDLDHNRFLILQGEVEQISLMSAKGTDSEPGMLEYLEDIIGTTRYKMPLSQLSDRVEHLSELRSEKLNRLKLVKHELDELKVPMEEAIGFLELENKITNKKNFIYQKNIVDLENNSEELCEKLDETEKLVIEFNEKIKAVGTEKKVKATKLAESSHKYEAFEKRKESLKAAFDSANTKDIELQTVMTQVNNNRKKMKEQIVTEKKKLESYERLPKESEKDIKDFEKKEAEMIKKKQRLEEDKLQLLSTLGNQTKDLQERKAAIQTKLVSLNKIVDEAKSAYTLAESELKIFLSNSETENNKLEQLRHNYESSKATISQNTSEIEKLKRKIPEAENALKKSNEELLEIKREEAQIVNDMRKNRGQLEECRSSMQASRSRGKILDSLMQQKNEGNCPGVFGRLGDLGAIDGKYDVAVSTACGPLDNIVVDSVNTAQWCIEFLKQYNIGRATFLVLDKQEHLRKQYSIQFNSPENVPRLFDLIKIADDRVKPAFYYALRDTLVAETLDQASRIAYGAKRYRVVSLGGDLIETTGTMSGGGKTVSRGRMGRSVAAASTASPRELDKMEKDLSNMNQRLQEVRTRQTQLETQLTMLTPELRGMKNAFEKYSIELKSLVKQEPNLKAQLEAQETKVKKMVVDQAMVKKLSTVVKEKKQSYEEASENTSELQGEVDVLTKEIKDKTQGKVQTLDKHLRETTKSIDKFKAEITRLKVGLKTAERNSIKAVENIASMEQDIEAAENELRRIKGQREEIESDAQQLLSRIEEISSQLTEEEEDFSGLKQEVDNLTKNENKLKAEKIEVDQKFKVLTEKMSEIKANIHHWRLKITHLKYQEIPEQEPLQFQTYTREELDSRDIRKVEKELQIYEEEHKAAKPNLNAILEYNKKQDTYITRSNELEEVTERRKKMRGYHDMLHTRRKEEFITGYNIIKMKLKEMYQMITLGGDADFEMLDTFDPFNEGIQFRVRPPKKTWKLITNLSGGEKTLSSLALVFALHYYKPSPLYVMDEIDAALDFKNVSIVGNYIKERTKNAQFIIISLRSNMFELADYLIGIYKTFNVTKSLAMNPKYYDTDKNVNAISQNTSSQTMNANTQNTNANTQNTNGNNENTNGNNENTNGNAVMRTEVTAADVCMDMEPCV